ncbi:DUF1566 domain-containing protein [Aestuariibacter salexigens]|uniref:Lcl C-terminal domain-containing protein n=1 Tax=Aestuariibacter salexigens TaxID=226010 RepID=UPI00047D2E91|nr:DUF1566 domain-containing protein [Aestuariibacter salexigens]
MKYWIGILVMIVGCNVSAQSCLVDIDDTTASSEFTDLEDGTVLHVRTGLVWMRCSLGQTWNGSTCINEADELTWQQALDQAYGYEFADSLAWRLPNIKELASITERSCVRPSINETIFPNTSADDYWTSTPSMADPQRAWVVAFFNSSNSIKQKDRSVFVRLVRNAD